MAGYSRDAERIAIYWKDGNSRRGCATTRAIGDETRPMGRGPVTPSRIIIHKVSLSCHNSCVIALFSSGAPLRGTWNLGRVNHGAQLAFYIFVHRRRTAGYYK